MGPWSWGSFRENPYVLLYTTNTPKPKRQLKSPCVYTWIWQQSCQSLSMRSEDNLWESTTSTVWVLRTKLRSSGSTSTGPTMSESVLLHCKGIKNNESAHKMWPYIVKILNYLKRDINVVRHDIWLKCFKKGKFTIITFRVFFLYHHC